jgi:hypothetical protein
MIRFGMKGYQIMDLNKIIFLTFFGFSSFLNSIIFSQSIHINFLDGSISAFNLVDVSKLTFNSNLMNLHLNNGTVYSWNVSTIQHYRYDETSLVVEELESNLKLWSVELFPNPISSVLKVQLNLLEYDEISIDFFDIEGKLLVHRNADKYDIGEYNHSFDLSNLTEGTYFCRLSGLQNSTTTKFIKN